MTMKRIFILLTMAIVFLPACSNTRWIRTPVIKNRDFIVTLEQRQVEGNIIGQAYEHPYHIDLPVLKTLMGDLTYIEEVGLMGKEEEMPVFQAVEIERLAPVLADTLTKADASQRIRFRSFNRGKGLIFSVSRETEGVIFIQPNNQLNIAFNFINSEIDFNEAPTVPSSYSLMDPLKIKNSATTIHPSAAYATLHQFETDKPAPMWVIADLEKIKKTAGEKPLPMIEDKKEIVPAAAPESEMTKTAVETPAPAADDKLEDIKNKLKYLKELLDEGLISEKDYDAKKAELLDKIK